MMQTLPLAAMTTAFDKHAEFRDPGQSTEIRGTRRGGL